MIAPRWDQAPALRMWLRWALGHAPKPEGDVPWTAVRASRTEALVYGALRADDDPRAETVAAVARQIAAVNLTRSLALPPVLGEFERVGIPYAVYKGAALTEQCPRLRAVRAVSDADVMVRPRDFHRARRALTEAGFDEQRAAEPVSIVWNNERVYVRRTPTELHVDLHRGLHRAPLFAELSEAMVAGAEWTGRMWVVPAQLAPLAIAAHRAKHGFTADLRELLDIHALREERAYDPHDLAADARRFGVTGAMYATLGLVRWWFGEGDAAEDAAFTAMEAQTRHAGAVASLASLDSPTDADKPWARAPFLKLYLPLTVLTDRAVLPLALAGAHVVARALDVAVAGPNALGVAATRPRPAATPAGPRTPPS